MLRIAVIGAGRIGKVHAATVAAHPQAQLVLVCDPFIEAAKALADPLGARASADAAEAFSADDVDAVVIGSPTPLHAEHVLAAARAGKASLCEKPVARGNALYAPRWHNSTPKRLICLPWYLSATLSLTKLKMPSSHLEVTTESASKELRARGSKS